MISDLMVMQYLDVPDNIRRNHLQQLTHKYYLQSAIVEHRLLLQQWFLRLQALK